MGTAAHAQHAILDNHKTGVAERPQGERQSEEDHEDEATERGEEGSETDLR